MKSVALKTFSRTALRRSALRQLRASNRIPAVIYGVGVASRNLELEEKDIRQLLRHSASENLLVDLSLDNGQDRQLALVKELQHHPLSGKVLHIDFQEIDEQKPVTVSVPIEPEGDAIGVRNGGVLQMVLFQLRLRGLIKDMPDIVHVDVTDLDLGTTLSAGQIPLPQGVEIMGDKGIPAITIAIARVAEEEAAPAELETAAVSEEVAQTDAKSE